MGTVTNPTGTVNGKNLATLLDCYAGTWSGIIHPAGAAMAQWNYLAPLLSDTAGACAAEGSGGGFRGSELTLRLTVVGYKELPSDAPVFPPPADLPLTLTVGTAATSSDGVHRILNAYVMQARSNGNQGPDTAVTSGTVTFTAMDPATGLHEGAWDLWFGAARTAGSFSAPWCGSLPA